MLNVLLLILLAADHPDGWGYILMKLVLMAILYFNLRKEENGETV